MAELDGLYHRLPGTFYAIPQDLLNAHWMTPKYCFLSSMLPVDFEPSNHGTTKNI